MGFGNEGTELKVSRAYIAGLGTTGVLIGSFLLLLTVGSALVAFQGVPGQATNGDLSSIELRQQSERAAQGDGGLLVASDLVGDSASGAQEGASGDVFGVRAAASEAAGLFLGSTGRGQRDALHPGSPTAPLGERVPSSDGPTSAPGNGVLATSPVSSGESSGSGSDTGSGSSDSGTGSDTGSGTDSSSGSGTGSGTGTGTSSDSGSGSSSSGGATSTDSGSGSSGSGSSSDSGSTTTGTVTDTVGDTTGTVGSVVGVGGSGTGETATDAGATTSGLLDDVTSVVDTLTG
jgi:hypothetical protein